MKRFLSGLLALLLVVLFVTGVWAAENSLGMRADQNGGGLEYEHSLFEKLSVNTTIGYEYDYYSESNNQLYSYLGFGFKYYPISEGQAGFYLDGYGSQHKMSSGRTDYNGYTVDDYYTDYQIGLGFGYKYLFNSGLYLDFGASGIAKFFIGNRKLDQKSYCNIMVPGGFNLSFGYAW